MDEALQAKTSPWHEGELALQRSVGAVDMMAGVGQRQLARTWMPDQHREFYAQLPFVVLGAVDRQGDVWATLRAGQPGFMNSPDPQTLHIDLEPEPNDPAQEGMGEGDAIGMLGIELHTRRRNRMNGVVRRQLDPGLEISVSQAYGNCPRYINLRQYHFVDAQAVAPRQLTVSDPLVRRLVTAADSFYIATYVVRDGERQVDASHRGGKPGFVRMDEDGSLTIPDFSGNLFFNTLGNILLNPRAGLVFVDFQTGDLLQMSGSAQVLLDDPEISAFQGAERLLRFTPQRIVYRPAAIALRWKDQDEGDSPNSMMTGSWEQAAERLQAEALRSRWRALQVARVVDESHNIRSFYLQASDGLGLPRFEAGQHLPVRILLEGQNAPSIRTYSVSSAPSDDFCASASSAMVRCRLTCMIRCRRCTSLRRGRPRAISPSRPPSDVRWSCWQRAWASHRCCRCCARWFTRANASAACARSGWCKAPARWPTWLSVTRSTNWPPVPATSCRCCAWSANHPLMEEALKVMT